jgi:hypothetical protein
MDVYSGQVMCIYNVRKVTYGHCKALSDPDSNSSVGCGCSSTSDAEKRCTFFKGVSDSDYTMGKSDDR